MKLVFVTEARFTKDAQGNIYGDSSFNFELWQRYLEVFSKIVIMARIHFDADFIGNANYLSHDQKVSFIELPFFIGPLQYVRKRKDVQKKIIQSLENIDAVFICRVPGNISNIVIKYLTKRKIPFGVEVVGDPWDVFAPGSIKHPLRFFFRIKGYFDLKNNIRLASAALYVTQFKLQKRYPVKSFTFQTGVSDVKIKENSIDFSTFQISASNVKIKDSLIVLQAKKHTNKKEYTLLSIGSLEQMYKGPDVVLKALKTINEDGFDCKLIWLGDGIYKNKMQNLAKQLGISENVDFKGNVSANEVREYLLAADIFVLASRTEGLPRAVIEAMSSGIPCIGTNVGGIPELLEVKALIPKDNPKALTKKIKDLITEPDFYNQQAIRNLIESANYKESILTDKRNNFYRYLISLKS